MLIDYQKVNIVQDDNVVLKDVNLQVDEGDFVYIIGLNHRFFLTFPVVCTRCP